MSSFDNRIILSHSRSKIKGFLKFFQQKPALL